jgi:tripartite-type tricarboxylate transporter receptor subunit TctC
MLTRRVLLECAFAGIAMPGTTLHALAQALPAKPITIVVPYPPGGPIDTLARIIAQDAAGDLKQTIVVENRPGGSGLIATGAVARAEPDGSTLILGTTQTHATSQSLIKNWGFDAVKDFAPVAGVAAMPHVLIVRKDFPATSVAELVALAKAKPGSLTFGSAGPGSSPHLAGELLKAKAGIDMLHVPYKGISQMVPELLAGRVDLSIAPLPGLIAQQIASGSVRALGIASAKRSPQLPNVPTIAEAGVAGVEADAWSALFAPAKTPPATIERLYQAIATTMTKESVQASLARQGLPVSLKTPAEMSAMLPGEIEKWANVIRLAHVTLE